MNKHREEHEIVCKSTVEALFSLMEQKPFSEITITSLVKKAGIARTTYYRNYTSKEDVLASYIDDILHEFELEFPIKSLRDCFKRKYIIHTIEYVGRYEKQLRILDKSGLSFLYLDRLNHFLFESCSDKTLSEKEIFEIYALAGAQFNIIFNGFMGEGSTKKIQISDFIKR